MDATKTNPTLEALINLRPAVQKIRDALKELSYSRPPAVAPELLAKVREAAGHVRQAREALRKTENAVAAQVAAIEGLPFDTTDSELKAEHAKLCELREALELATHRAKAGVENQKGKALYAKREAEQAGETRRLFAMTVLAEIGGTPLGTLPTETLGCYVEQLVKELEQLVSSFRHEVLHSIATNIEHEIGSQLQR